MKHWMIVKVVASISALSLLTACGGGSGDSTTAPVPTYTVGGQVTGMGLVGSVTLLNKGADAVTVKANGEFVFATKVVQGSAYAVTVQTQPTGQTCTVTNGTGSVSANVTNVLVSCLNKAAKFAYTTDNSYDSLVVPYAIDSTTGALTANGNPVSTPPAPFLMAVGGAGKFVYVSSEADNKIRGYKVNVTTGNLTPIVGAVSVGAFVYSMIADPNGKFLYAVSLTEGNISIFSINGDTGILTSVGNVNSGAGSYSIAFDPTGKFAYLANAGGAISTYRMNGATGMLTEESSLDVLGINPPFGIVVDPTGRFLYTTSVGRNTISSYSINTVTGALTAVGDSLATGVDPYFLAVDPTGRYVYVSNATDNTISAYIINQATGILASLGAPIATRNGPYGITVDPTGRFVYVANYGGNALTIYNIDVSTGVLTPNSEVNGLNSPANVVLISN